MRSRDATGQVLALRGVASGTQGGCCGLCRVLVAGSAVAPRPSCLVQQGVSLTMQWGCPVMQLAICAAVAELACLTHAIQGTRVSSGLAVQQLQDTRISSTLALLHMVDTLPVACLLASWKCFLLNRPAALLRIEGISIQYINTVQSLCGVVEVQGDNHIEQAFGSFAGRGEWFTPLLMTTLHRRPKAVEPLAVQNVFDACCITYTTSMTRSPLYRMSKWMWVNR